MNGRGHRRDRDSIRNYPGVILLITLVILVILSTLGYTLSVRVAARRHRNQYIIDYSVAKHACVSGMRYALASLDDLTFQLISRPNEPDFSDVFSMSEPEYQKLLDQMALYLAERSLTDPNSQRGAKDTDAERRDAAQLEDIDDANDMDPNSRSSVSREAVKIPGPYGPPWPLVTEPAEFEIGTAKVTIGIEDENAKFPLGWAVLEDQKLREEAGAAWTTFCEWMGYVPQEIVDLNKDLVQMGEVKPFRLAFKPETAEVEPPASLRSRITRPTPGRTTASTAVRRTTVKKAISPAEQLEQQNKEFAKLSHSSLLNTALLSRPSIDSDSRKESAMRYLGLWATRHVNVNTAPRHVLEAAVTFGSVIDAPKIAEAIIRQRQIKPIADVNELKSSMLGYSDSIEGCKDFLTVASTVFTVRVTAVCGAARVTALAAVSKEGDKIQQIAVISDW